MKDTRIYKVRLKENGLFATKRQYSGVDWTEVGSMWRGVGALKLAFRNGSLREVSFEDVDILLYLLEEKGVVKWNELRSINEG